MCKAWTMVNFDTSKDDGVSDNDGKMSGLMNSDVDPANAQMPDADVRVVTLERR